MCYLSFIVKTLKNMEKVTGSVYGEFDMQQARSFFLFGPGSNFNFNCVQLALVLEDYEPPALRVQGFGSRKYGARSMVEEKKEGETK